MTFGESTQRLPRHSQDFHYEELNKVRHLSFRKMLNTHGPGLDPAERDAMEALLFRCFRLDPRERSSAAELLKDPWWGDVDVEA